MSENKRAWAEIDLSAIRQNIASVRSVIGRHVAIMAVVKADAYGHGILPVARTAVSAGCSWLGVAAVDEGTQLRREGITAPVAVLAPCAPSEASDIVEFGLTAMVGDTLFVDALARAMRAKPCLNIHIDVDTGMGRSGALPTDVAALWKYASSAGLHVTGLTTHFSDADGINEGHTANQILQFQVALHSLQQIGAEPEWIHLSNSAATLVQPAAHCNMVRPGLLMYGITPPLPGSRIHPLATNLDLRPALSLFARVATVRSLPAGHAIGYGATCHLKRDSRVATVAIGYGDGYLRRLSNCGYMLIRGHQAPIMGKVSMDQTVVDVTDIPGVAPDDIATCIGCDGTAHVSVVDLAHRAETTEHELTTLLTPRIPRSYRDE